VEVWVAVHADDWVTLIMSGGGTGAHDARRNNAERRIPVIDFIVYQKGFSDIARMSSLGIDQANTQFIIFK